MRASRPLDRRARLVRGISLVLAVASAAGLAGLSAPAPAQAADGDSAVTVAWAGGNGDALQQYQPERDTASVHYGDFKDVEVTVSRTRDLVDEAISVTVAGMPSATQRMQGHLGLVDFGGSFVQAMQCWGDPQDELFYQNCQFGAMGLRGAGNAAPPIAVNDNLRGGQPDVDVPFRDVYGRQYSSQITGVTGEDTELLKVFRAQTTNERTVAVDSARTSRFEFEVQSAASQPYLGCGDVGTATGTRCWLVIVPRGLHTSAAAPGCVISNGGRDAGRIQQNSPVNPQCEYWDNRVVVPLDFRPAGAACAAGSQERRVVGSDLAQTAFASWQAHLCGTTGTAYSLTVSADALAREQLVGGQAQMVLTPRGIAPDTVGRSVDPTQIAEQDIVYAPVTVGAVGIAFLANLNGRVVDDIRLTPRLVAKLVTQSYALEQGMQLYAVDPVPGPWTVQAGNANTRLTSDPEFLALNGDLPTLMQGASIVLTGPNGSDLIGLLWDYLQADDAARAFLSGDPDNIRPGDEKNSGMTVNPYYLPQGHPDARVPELTETVLDLNGIKSSTLVPVRDRSGEVRWRQVGLVGEDGEPLCLCDGELSTFPKSDETLLPQRLDSEGQPRYDLLQSRPYAPSTEAAALQVFRADTGAKTLWDATNPRPGVAGSYVANGVFRQTDVFLAGYTDAASAARLRLPTAALQVPNQPGTFVRLDDASMAAAMGVQEPTAVAGVGRTDPATLPTDAYPLTSAVYAAVNLGASDEAARAQYADLIEFAVTGGQVRGHSVGELPEGYLPLSDAQRDQALAAVAAIRAYVPPSEDVAPAPTSPTAAPPAAAATSTTQTGPATTVPQTGYVAATSAEPTPTPATAPGARAVLGGTLLAGLAGAVAGPFLLRRRELTP